MLICPSPLAGEGMLRRGGGYSTMLKNFRLLKKGSINKFYSNFSKIKKKKIFHRRRIMPKVLLVNDSPKKTAALLLH